MRHGFRKVRFRVVLDGRKDDAQPMTRQADGWFELVTYKAPAGTRYQYLLPDGLAVPDPASRFQPSSAKMDARQDRAPHGCTPAKSGPSKQRPQDSRPV